MSAELDTDRIVESRVVTLAEIAGRLSGVRRLVVPYRAVVTPSARDELLRREIELVYGKPADERAKRHAKIVLSLVKVQFDLTPLAAVLGNCGAEIHQQTHDCLIEATDRLGEELTDSNTIAALLTVHSAAAVCLANRHRAVRAVLAGDPAATSAAVAAVGANMLVVDPSLCRAYQARQVMIQFCRGGPRRCPDVFKDRLG
jgi:hypothetical protein